MDDAWRPLFSDELQQKFNSIVEKDRDLLFTDAGISVVAIYPNVPTYREVQEYNAARRVVSAEIPS